MYSGWILELSLCDIDDLHFSDANEYTSSFKIFIVLPEEKRKGLLTYERVARWSNVLDFERSFNVFEKII